MKSWTYYRNPTYENGCLIPYFGYKETQLYKKERLKVIDDELMTAEGRTSATKNLAKEVRELVKDKNAGFNKKLKELEEEFWRDAREDLGYDSFLTEEGVKILEGKAWGEGHSSGYSEVYGCLQDLSEFVISILEYKKEE